MNACRTAGTLAGGTFFRGPPIYGAQTSAIVFRLPVSCRAFAASRRTIAESARTWSSSMIEVGAVAADAAAGAGNDGRRVFQRKLATVLRVGGVGREHQRLDAALRRVQRQQGRAVAAADHLAPPQQARLRLHQRVVDTERQAMACARTRQQRQHQAGAIGRATPNRGGQGKAARKAVETCPAHFLEVDAGVPHQRAVAKDPEVFAADVGQYGLARALDVCIGQTPVIGQALRTRLRIPGSQHLIGQAQPRSLGRRDAPLQLWQVHEGLRGHGALWRMATRDVRLTISCGRQWRSGAGVPPVRPGPGRWRAPRWTVPRSIRRQRSS